MASAEAQAAAGSQTQKSGEDLYPWYNIRDEETPEGFWLLKIIKDSPEGRAYTQLTTREDRLEYMRKHHHEKIQNVRPNTAIWEDKPSGQEWHIKIGSPEWEGLRKLKPADGSSWPMGSPEQAKVEQYYKEHGAMKPLRSLAAPSNDE